MGAETILNMPVYDYLWGYDDPIIELAGTIVPGFVNFRKFGLLDRVRTFPMRYNHHFIHNFISYTYYSKFKKIKVCFY